MTVIAFLLLLAVLDVGWAQPGGLTLGLSSICSQKVAGSGVIFKFASFTGWLSIRPLNQAAGLNTWTWPLCGMVFYIQHMVVVQQQASQQKPRRKFHGCSPSITKLCTFTSTFHQWEQSCKATKILKGGMCPTCYWKECQNLFMGIWKPSQTVRNVRSEYSGLIIPLFYFFHNIFQP